MGYGGGGVGYGGGAGGGGNWGTGGGGTGGTTYYAPYVPKGGPSRVWFHLIIDESIVQEGEHVCIRGELEELGGDDGPGIPMRQAEDDPAVWEVDIELPIGMNETHFRGLFDYRFAVERIDGSDLPIEEGSVARSSNDMFAHFYHNCRTNVR